MTRSGSSASGASFLTANFPPKLDLADPLHQNGLRRARGATSDSSSSSSSVSLSSQVSSPTSSCTELNTPIMPTFHGMSQPDAALLNSNNAFPIFVAQEDKSDLGIADARFCMPPPPTFVSHSYGSFDSSSHASTHLMPTPTPLTYSSLASSSSASRNIGLKIVGMHSDPFLMSQPLPSPSLFMGSPAHPAMSSSSSLLLGPHPSRFGEHHYSQPMPSTSFENLLRLPTRLSTCTISSDISSSEDPCFPTSPPPSSASVPQTSPETDEHGLPLLTGANLASCEAQRSGFASLSLERAIAEFASRSPANSTSNAASSHAITSQPFASVVEKIGARFGLDQNGKGLPHLISCLQLSGKVAEDTETCKGLVFDAAIDWDVMGSNMLPTTEQLLYPHRAFVDACLPWPAVRSRLLKHTLTNPVCEEELALDLLLSILSSKEKVASFRVYGDDVFDPEAWELSQAMLTKWWGLFDDSVIRRSNWWRRQRGLPELSTPVPHDAANESERQGLGTGSLDQVHRLATTLLQ